MRGLNRVTLIGHLGRDPAIRHTQAGEGCANLSVATVEEWKDRQTGEKQSRTEWHRIVVWGWLVEVCKQYLTKGSHVYLEGQLQTRKWQDQEGNDRFSTEVVLRQYGSILLMLGGGGNHERTGAEGYANRRNPPRDGPGGSAPGGFDDEIPF